MTANRRALTRVTAASVLLASSAAFAADDYVVTNYAIEQPLTSTAGDPTRGAVIVAERASGNCLSCHAIPIDAEFFGTTGPDLRGVGRRLNAAQLRLRIVDPKLLNPMTMMPAYYRTEGLQRVREDLVGKPVLNAQQVEDVVAFLLTLQ